MKCYKYVLGLDKGKRGNETERRGQQVRRETVEEKRQKIWHKCLKERMIGKNKDKIITRGGTG